MQLKEKEYYNEITNIIESVEINSSVRQLQDNGEKLQAYWNIGRLIVEAQGGKRASYGNDLIKKWSYMLSSKYGNKYGKTNLKNMRQFYVLFPKSRTLCDKLLWSHYRYLLPIKNENERNYYINQVILNNLSVRELRNEIKNKAFDRLSYADKENIKLINNKDYNLTIEDMIKDPILIKTNKEINKLDEKALHKYMIEMLEHKFLELGTGFTLAGHEYKINVEGHSYRLDLLFFNVKLNCYVVVELKIKSVQYKDIEQVVFYTKLVNKYVKENSNNKTIGVIIVREYDTFMIKYTTSRDIIMTTYKMLKN